MYTASMPGDAEHDATLPFPVHRDPVGHAAADTGGRPTGEPRSCGSTVATGSSSAPRHRLGLLAHTATEDAGARRIVALTHGHEAWWARVPVARQLLRRIGDSVDVMTYVSEWCRDADRCRRCPSRLPRGWSVCHRVWTRDRFHPDAGGDEVRRRLGIPRRSSVVVCTARMVERKGQDTLVQVPGQTCSVPTRCATAARRRRAAPGGGRADGASSRALGDDGGVHRVACRGTDVPAYTDAGTCFAMPCRTRRFGLEAEAFGIVFLEAQACGSAGAGRRLGRCARGGAPRELGCGARGVRTRWRRPWCVRLQRRRPEKSMASQVGNHLGGRVERLAAVLRISASWSQLPG